MTVHKMDSKTVAKVLKCTASIFNKSVIETTLKWIIIDAFLISVVYRMDQIHCT